MELNLAQSPVLFGPSLALGAGLVILLTYLITQLLRIGSRPAGMPPGPPTRPFWGNLKEIPLAHPHFQYTRWAAHYGPIYTLMRGTTPTLIISSAPAAHDIFNRRGALTSGRPANRLDLECRGGYAPFLMTGPKWREARRMWHSILNVGAAKAYLPYQMLEAAKLVADVGREPGRWRAHVDRYSNSVGMGMMNGMRVPTAEDPSIQEALHTLIDYGQLILRWGWLDYYPWVWRLPAWAVPGRREAAALTAKHMPMLWRYWEGARERKGGKQMPSFIAAVQKKLAEGWEGLTEREATEVASELLIAATDTGASSLNNFVASMALFPEVQRKAQEEIDRVVGPGRLPTDADAIDLPYTRQVVQELQRWLTAVPIGVPHATTAPMQVGEYHIPTGTILILNSYAIHSDPETYPEPREFRPERWEGKLEVVTSDDQVGARSDLFSFGAGRRICPGQHVAERTMYLGVSHLLWAFDIRKAKDKAGNEIPIDMDSVRPGLVETLNEYEVDLSPRSKERAELIKRNWQQLRETLLDKDEQWIQSPEGVAENLQKTAR